MEKIFYFNANLQLLRNMDWESVDGTTKIFEIKSFDFQHIKNNTEFEKEFRIIKEEFVTDISVNEKWQITEIVTISLPNNMSDSAPLEYFKKIISRTIPIERYFYTEIKYIILNTKNVTLNFQDIFLDTLILSNENIDLSESFAKFIINAITKNFLSNNLSYYNINSIINKLVIVDKVVIVDKKDSGYIINNIQFNTHTKALQTQSSTNVLLDFSKIWNIFESIVDKDKKASCIYFFNYVILEIISPNNINIKYINNEEDTFESDTTIILLPVDFNKKISLQKELFVKLTLEKSNSNKFKVPIILPDLNIENLDDILMKLDLYTIDLTHGILYKYIIVNSEVNINNLVSNFNEASDIQKNNIIILIRILKSKDLVESEIKIIADTSKLGSDKISDILRIYISPTLIKADTLILPDDDKFYKKTSKLNEFKNIYYTLVNDFIFSANTIENSYFDQQLVYESLFGKTPEMRRVFLELFGLYLDDTQEITKDQKKSHKKKKKAIDKVIKKILKINHYKFGQIVDPMNIYKPLLDAIDNYKKFIIKNHKNAIYLPKLKDIKNNIYKNYLNIFRTESPQVFQISINDNIPRYFLKKTLELIKNYHISILVQKYTKNSEIDEQLKEIKIIINFEKNNFIKFVNFQNYTELIHNVIRLPIYPDYFNIPPIINLQQDEIIKMVLIIPNYKNFQRSAFCLEQVKDRINFLFEEMESMGDVNDDNVSELFNIYANFYKLYFPEIKYHPLDFINKSGDYYKLPAINSDNKKIINYVNRKSKSFRKEQKDKRIQMFNKLVYYFIAIFQLNTIIYNIKLPTDNKKKKQFLNNLQDRLIIEINKKSGGFHKFILKFDELDNFYPLQKIIKKYDIDNRYQNLEFIVNNGKDVMNKKKFDDVKDEFLRICNKINKKNKNVLDFQLFNKTIINSIDREFRVKLPSIKKNILEQIFYNMKNARIIDISSDEFYKDLWYMNKPNNTNILIEYTDQSRDMLTITSDGDFYAKNGFIHNRFFIGNNFSELKQLDELVNEKNEDYKNKVYTFSKSGISDVHILRFKILNIFDRGDDIKTKTNIRKLLNLNNILSTYTNLVKLNHLNWSYVDSIGIDAGGPLRLSLLKISEEIGINIMEPIKYKNNKCLFYNFKKKKDKIDDIYKDDNDTSNSDVFLGKLFSKCLIFNYVMSINLDPIIYYIIIESFNFINNDDEYNNLDGSFFNKIEESKIIISSYIKDNLLAHFSNLKEFLDIELEIYDENLLGSECRHYDYLINLAKMSKPNWETYGEDDNRNLLVNREINGEIEKIYPYPFDDSIMQTPPTLKSEKNCFVESKEDDTKIKDSTLCNEKKFITLNKLVNDDEKESKFKSVKIPAVINLNFCNSKGKCQEHPSKFDRGKLKQSNFKLFEKLKKKAWEPYIKKYEWDDNGKEKKIIDYFKYMLEGNRLDSICNFTWGFLYNIYNISDEIGGTSEYQQRFINNFEKLTVRDLDTLITGIKEIQIDDFIKNMIATDIDSEYALTIFEIIKNKIREESQRDKNYLNLLHRVFLDSWNVPIGGFVRNLKLKFYPSSNENRQIMQTTGKDDANKITISDIENTIDGITNIHSCFGTGDVYTNDKYETLFNDKLRDPEFLNNMTEKIKFVEKEGLVKDILKFFTLESMKIKTESFADNPYNIG